MYIPINWLYKEAISGLLCVCSENCKDAASIRNVAQNAAMGLSWILPTVYSKSLTADFLLYK